MNWRNLNKREISHITIMKHEAVRYECEAFLRLC